MKHEPFIGITCDVTIPRREPAAYELSCDHRYPEIVKVAGGYPVLLPIARRPRVMRRYLDEIDGLIIVGGDDVDPRLYGEKPRRGTGAVFGPRLRFEQRLYRAARRRDLPVLGICYGMQLINVLEGGTLYQDIRRDAGSRHRHRSGVHRVTVRRDSRLRRILRRDRFEVATEHHQAVRGVAPGFRAAAFADDGIVEAIEESSGRILAVQWHPERTPEQLATRRLFREFVGLCGA